MAVRLFMASVSFQNEWGQRREETFPIRTHETRIANEMAMSYVLGVLRLRDFELRVVGA